MGGKQDHVCKYIINELYQSPRTGIAMSALYSVAALATTVLNSLILISIWKTPSLHKPSYILIGSLALSDLLVGALGEPLMVIENIAILRGWPLDFCTVFICTRGVNYVLGGISLLTLTLISLDRLLAVKLRNRYQSVVTQKRVLLVLVTLWIAACCTSATLTGHLNLNLNFQILTALILYVGVVVSIPVYITITVCYSMAFYSLRKITSSSVSPSVQNAEAVARPRFNIDIAKYRKSLVTMLIVFICTILFYSPFACIYIAFPVIEYSLSYHSKKVIDSFYIDEFIYLLNSAVNPLLYLWRMRDIREPVKTTALKIFKLP